MNDHFIILLIFGTDLLDSDREIIILRISFVTNFPRELFSVNLKYLVFMLLPCLETLNIQFS